VETPASPLTQIIVVPGGGAIARVPDDATALIQRSAPWNLHYLSMWEPDPSQDDRNITWTRALVAAMKPFTSGKVYLNFIGDEGLHRVESAYGAETYQRLREIKKVWDPDNVFRHNQNIPPAT
jgi:FAD/FMN-containing dehydrogenase